MSFLCAVGSMCRKERPQDIDHLLRLADTLLEAHEQSMAQLMAAKAGDSDGADAAPEGDGDST